MKGKQRGNGMTERERERRHIAGIIRNHVGYKHEHMQNEWDKESLLAADKILAYLGRAGWGLKRHLMIDLERKGRLA